MARMKTELFISAEVWDRVIKGKMVLCHVCKEPLQCGDTMISVGSPFGITRYHKKCYNDQGIR